MSKSETMRWILFIPASIVGFYLALLIMILVQTSVESMCPEQYIFIGEREYCIYPSWVNTALISIGGALAAFLVVLLGSLVAPGYKNVVPYVLFIGGAIIASYMIAVLADSVVEYLMIGVSTFSVGIITAVLFSKREARDVRI